MIRSFWCQSIICGTNFNFTRFRPAFLQQTTPRHLSSSRMENRHQTPVEFQYADEEARGSLFAAVTFLTFTLVFTSLSIKHIISSSAVAPTPPAGVLFISPVTLRLFVISGKFRQEVEGWRLSPRDLLGTTVQSQSGLEPTTTQSVVLEKSF